MSQFEALTKYIPLIEQDEIGHWHIDRENDGTLEHPIQLSFVVFSEMSSHFNISETFPKQVLYKAPLL